MCTSHASSVCAVLVLWGAAILGCVTRDGVQEHGTQPSIVEPPRDAIHGRVLGSEGEGIAGAEVRLLRFPTRQNNNAHAPDTEPVLVENELTGSDGRFEFAGPLLGEFRIDVASAESPESRFPVPAGDDIDIVLGGGGRIEGLIHCDGHQDEALSGTVRLSTRGGAARLVMNSTILSDGSFEFPGLPPNAYLVEARIDRHAAKKRIVILSQWRAIGRADFFAEPGIVLRGRVLDAESNAPISGAEVEVSGLADCGLKRTDENGLFCFEEIPPHPLESRGSLSIMTRAPGYIFASAPFDPDVECVVHVARAEPLPIRISGRLLDHLGQAVAGAQLIAEGRSPRVSPSGHWIVSNSQTITGADGAFELPWRAGQHTTVEVFDPVTGSHRLLLGVVVGNRELGEVSLWPTFTWNLRFLDEAGRPIANAPVSLAQHAGQVYPPYEVVHGSDEYEYGPIPYAAVPCITDSFGRCRLMAAQLEQGQIEVENWSFSLPLAQEGDHVLALEGYTRRVIRVLDSARQPVSDVYLAAASRDGYQPHADLLYSGGMLPARGNGEFLLEGRNWRALPIFLHLQGSAVGDVECVLSLEAQPIEIVLGEFTDCSLQVIDSVGEPLARALVLELRGFDQEVLRGRTDRQGRFPLRLLPGAGARLVARGPSGRRSAPLTVLAGETRAVIQVP